MDENAQFRNRASEYSTPQSLSRSLSNEGLESEKRVPEKEAEKWAGLLIQALTPPRESTNGISSPSSTPQGTRDSNGTANASDSSNGAKTPSSVQSHSTDTASVKDTGPQRLILNINSETLGRVQLIVEREEGGIKVIIGSEANARSRISSDKHTLLEALKANGVRVNSLRVVKQSEVGILLAQDLMSKKTRISTRGAAQRTPHKDSRTKKNNLNLIG